MTRIRIYLLLTFLIPFSITARQSASVQDGIDYQRYASSPGLYDLDSLRKLVVWLDSQSMDTRVHLETLYGIHFEAAPIDNKDTKKLDKEVSLGIALMNAEDMNFQILGDVLLQALSDSVQNGLNNESLDKEDPELLALIDKLKTAQYSISIPVSDKEKFIMNIKQGNFDYVFTRFKTRCILDCSNGLCDPMCRWFWALTFIGLPLLVLLFIYRKRIRLFSRLRQLRKT
ncbi:MAG: hypothetical protein HEP71_18145 [Roseivirga sp.]|nr:hypothetical protein [Roseivirga sp.]